MQSRPVDHRDRNKPALGKDDLGFQTSEKGGTLEKAGRDAENIGEILEIEIPAQLSRLNDVIGDTGNGLNQGALNAAGGSKVMDVPSFLKESGNKSLVG